MGWDPPTSSAPNSMKQSKLIKSFAHSNNVFFGNHMAISTQTSFFVYDFFLLCLC